MQPRSITALVGTGGGTGVGAGVGTGVGAAVVTFMQRSKFGSHTSSAAQHTPMLIPAQHVLPAGQHVAPCVNDDAWQHVDPASQQKAELFAPGPNSPQHDCDAAQGAELLKYVQHLSPELLGMHRGDIPPAPQQSSSSVQFKPDAFTPEALTPDTPELLTPEPLTLGAFHAGQFGTGVGAGVGTGVGAAVVTFMQRSKFGSHTSSAAQHTPMLIPAQHVLPAGQHVAPCVNDDAWQHVEFASQQKAELLAPGPNSPQHDCDAAQGAELLKYVQHLSPELLGMHCGNIPPAPQQSSSAAQFTPDEFAPEGFHAGQFGDGGGRHFAVVNSNWFGTPFTVVNHIQLSEFALCTHVAAEVGSLLSQELRVCIVAAKATPSSQVVVPAAGRWNAAYVWLFTSELPWYRFSVVPDGVDVRS
jgi:hypothetical protein